MRQSKINKALPSSVTIWLSEVINMLIFILIAFVLFIISKLILGTETIQLYDFQVKIFIVLLSYIGIFLGANNSFKKIKKNASYLPKGTKYLVLIYQILFIVGYSFLCYMYKYNVILFLGGYISIYVQFLFNTIYTSVNNKKYPQEKNINTDKIESKLSDNELIINVDKLK